MLNRDAWDDDVVVNNYVDSQYIDDIVMVVKMTKWNRKDDNDSDSSS